MSDIRVKPCSACPYRKDAPSGVWAAAEYDKLREYDKSTPEQPFVGFGCHSTPEFFCHGWAVTHSNRGHDRELLALRIAPALVPEAVVPLFDSGNEAADHGQSDIDCPSDEAHDAMDKLIRQHDRLSQR